MSKKVVFLASMMLLALAVHAQTEDSDKAEVLKRHQSKYGASKHGHVSYAGVGKGCGLGVER
jgi:hypothetical protein